MKLLMTSIPCTGKTDSNRSGQYCIVDILFMSMKAWFDLISQLTAPRKSYFRAVVIVSNRWFGELQLKIERMLSIILSILASRADQISSLSLG